MRTEVLGVGFDSLTMEEAVDRAFSIIKEGRGSKAAYVVTPNPEIVWLCRSEPELKSAIDGAALVLPDGIGIIHGARILGTPLKKKVSGIDFVQALMGRMAAEGMSVFLLGAKEGVARQAAKRLKELFPGLVIAGTHHGYFSDDEPIINIINEARPDLLLVCLGAPKQEYWMRNNAGKLKVGLMAGLGGTLDVFAGKVRRAPDSWQKLGLEWLYRLIQEPRRIKRMIKLPLFIIAVAGQRVGRRKNAG
ncbi:MAG: WecB/TagA/CpsF family glycosyltransferase [Oscillospiraceae bacterium]|jgi:N-acetylglucosaminyldiphosphoundecaprenol N-acetyl-beta-D-mannosaminyltransferase